MKILLTADWHFDRNNRLDDFIAATRYIAEYALHHDIKHVFIVGDVYRDWVPSSVERMAFHQVLSTLIFQDVEVTIMMGNHDVNDKQLEYVQHALSEFVDISSDKITLVYDAPRLKTIDGKVVLLIPHLAKAVLKGESYKDTFAKMLNKTKHTNLALSHTLMFEGISGPCNPEDARGVSLADIAGHLHCPLFMGDIHGHKVLQQDPVVAYIGSPERVTFNEIDDKKGFVVYDLNTRDYEFVPVPARKFLQIAIDLDAKTFWFTGAVKTEKAPLDEGDRTDILVAIIKALGDVIKDAVVKVVVTGHKQELVRINRHAVITHLKEALPYKIAKVSFDSNDDTVARDTTFTGHLTAKDAFEKWLGKQSYESKELTQSVQQAGMGMLNEEM